jgi:hypothetical protein
MGKKKIVAVLSIITLIISMFCFTPDSNAGIQTLNLSKQTKEIKVGESFQLTMTGVKASTIKWKSSKPGVATVSKKGVVKGVKAGTTNITGKYKSLKFTIKVKVVSTTEETTESKPTTPTSVIPSTGLYLGTCANVDLYITKIDDYFIYLKAINKNSFKVKVDYEYLNFDETTLNNIVSFEVAANNFRIYNDNFNEGAVPKNFKTVTGNVKIYNEDWELIESADLTAYVK